MLPICQDKQRLLSSQYQQNTLPHAIILHGMEGAGKGLLANWLIELLICQQPILLSKYSPDDKAIVQACGRCKCCLLKQSNSYPDHLLLASENKTLGVDDVRRGNAFLEKTAHLGLVKTILIPQAQTMTVAAANALLKTLEEPSPNSFIVLLTNDLETLLPTIVSRSAVYSIRPLVGEALLAQLNIISNADEFSKSDNHGAINDKAFVNFSQLAELTDEAIAKQFQEIKQYYLDYLYNGQYESKLLSLLIDNKHGLRWLEKITCNLVRNFYLENTIEPVTTNEISHASSVIMSNQDISVHVLNHIYQAIINSNKLIKSYTQANRQLVGEQLLMTINDIVRPSV